MSTNDYSKNIVYLSKEQYQELITNETLTVNDQTITYNDNDIYVTPQAEPITDVKINGTSIGSNGIVDIPMANETTPGVVKIKTSSSGINLNSNNQLIIDRSSDTQYKAGGNNFKVVTPYGQHQATFYGLSKVAGVDLANETVTLGIYPDSSKAAIQNMLGVTDLISTEESSPATIAHALNSTFMMNGKLHRATAAIAVGDAVEVGTNCEIVKADEVFVKNTDIAGPNNVGVVKTDITKGIGAEANGRLYIYDASIGGIKAGDGAYASITPRRQHYSVFYGLSKVAGVDLANEEVTLGTYPETSKTAIRSLIGAAAASDVPSVPVQDVQVNGTSILDAQGIANVPIAGYNQPGVVEINGLGLGFYTDGKTLAVNKANDSQVKAGEQVNRPVVPYNQHISAFYGLAKAAGSDEKNSELPLGTYSDNAKTAIRSLIGAAAASDVPSVPVQDVQINGTSIINNGIATIPVRSNIVSSSNDLVTSEAVNTALSAMFGTTSAQIKEGTHNFRGIVVGKQHESVFYGLAKVAGDSTQSISTNAVGTYTNTAKTAIRNMLGAVSSDVIAVQDEQPTTADTKVWLPETEPTGIEVPTYAEHQALASTVAGLPSDVQVNGTSVVSNNVANIPKAGSSTLGTVKINSQYGVNITSSGELYIDAAVTTIPAGTHRYFPIVPAHQHEATFYGLAKAAGDTTQSISTNAIGTYTSEAKAAIQTMLGIPQDIQMNGTSIVSNGIANIPVANGGNQFGVTKVLNGYAIGITYDAAISGGTLRINPATSSDIKNGAAIYVPITAVRQHEATFYGLAKAAGDTTQSISTNAVGTYTDEAKSAIRTMLGTISNTDYADNNTAGVVKVNSGLGIGIDSSSKTIFIDDASDANVKAGTEPYKPITPRIQHNAVFYGLTKAAGVDMASSSNAIGAYTPEAKAAIWQMLGLDGSTFINSDWELIKEDEVTNATSEILEITTDENGNTFELTDIRMLIQIPTQETDFSISNYALITAYSSDDSNKRMTFSLIGSNPYTVTANSTSKIGLYEVITDNGMSKLGGYGFQNENGRTNQQIPAYYSDTSNYREFQLKSFNFNKIRTTAFSGTLKYKLFGKRRRISTDSTTINVSGTTPTITAFAGHRYICGEVSTLSIIPAQSGDIEVIFTSGSTPTVLTLPNNVIMPEWFDATSLESDRTYDILITNGVYGMVMSWAI